MADLMEIARAAARAHRQTETREADPQPAKPTATESTGTGAECMGCRYLLMRYERHAGTRRVFWWRCGKGHELLESRCYGERVMLAPADCNSFERWQAGEP